MIQSTRVHAEYLWFLVTWFNLFSCITSDKTEKIYSKLPLTEQTSVLMNPCEKAVHVIQMCNYNVFKYMTHFLNKLY